VYDGADTVVKGESNKERSEDATREIERSLASLGFVDRQGEDGHLDMDSRRGTVMRKTVQGRMAVNKGMGTPTHVKGRVRWGPDTTPTWKPGKVEHFTTLVGGGIGRIFLEDMDIKFDEKEEVEEDGVCTPYPRTRFAVGT
jgi:hypothetical protein